MNFSILEIKSFLKSKSSYPFYLLVVLIAAVLYARPSDIPEQDPFNFLMGVIHLDVVNHRPHPPGFPLYMLAGKIFSFIVQDPLIGLQLLSGLSTIAGMLLSFYIFSMLFQEEISTVFISSLAVVFTPIIWYYSSAPYSEIPSGMLLTLSLYFFTKDHFSKDNSLGSYYFSWITLGAAIAVRPAILIPMIPASLVLIFLSKKTWKEILTGISLGGGLSLISAIWMFAVSEGSPSQIMHTTVVHMEFVGLMEGQGRSLKKIIDTFPSLWFSPAGYLFTIGFFYLLYQIKKKTNLKYFLFFTSITVVHIAWIMYTIRPYNFRYWTILFALIGTGGILGTALLFFRIQFKFARKAVFGMILIFAGISAYTTFPAIRIQRMTDMPLLAAAKFAKEYIRNNPQTSIAVQVHVEPYIKHTMPGIQYSTFLFPDKPPAEDQIFIQEFFRTPPENAEILFTVKRENKLIRKLGIERGFEATVYRKKPEKK